MQKHIQMSLYFIQCILYRIYTVFYIEKIHCTLYREEHLEADRNLYLANQLNLSYSASTESQETVIEMSICSFRTRWAIVNSTRHSRLLDQWMFSLPTYYSSDWWAVCKHVDGNKNRPMSSRAVSIYTRIIRKVEGRNWILHVMWVLKRSR